MTEHELEQALRRALRPVEPGEDFADRVVARLEGTAAGRHGRRRAFSHWVPVALAACAIAAIGLVSWRQERLGRQRGVEARAQLLQALSIASANVNAVRATVIRAADPMP